MSRAMTYEDVLPVLRAPAIARRDPATFHVEVPGNRVGAMPWAAFTSGGKLLERDEVARRGVTGATLFATALANLEARRATWRVEESAGGFLGIGKQAQVLSLVDELAAEQLLVPAFVKTARRLLTPKNVNGTFAIFAPRRGEVRAAAESFVARELERARATWASAGDAAVCPAQLGPSFTVGNTFAVGSVYGDDPGPYVPPIENVRAMVMTERTLGYVANGKTAPKRRGVGDLYLALGVRDANGAQTLLPEPVLAALGLSFDAALDERIATIPNLPVIQMAPLRSGHPVFGVRGDGAIDQLASANVLSALHAELGNPFLIHPYSHFKVAATTIAAPMSTDTLFDLVASADPPEPNVIKTRGTPDFVLYTVTNGTITAATPIRP
jgi:hypothetical protein